VQYDFSRIDDIDSFISIPEGRYACRVAEVREGLSRDGSPRWSLRLEVALGEYAGRTAGWDSLTWSERGIRRVKHVLDAFGLDVRGRVEITPADLLGREVVATFQSEEREDAFTGRRVLSLRVPYAGYAPPGALLGLVSSARDSDGRSGAPFDEDSASDGAEDPSSTRGGDSAAAGRSNPPRAERAHRGRRGFVDSDAPQLEPAEERAEFSTTVDHGVADAVCDNSTHSSRYDRSTRNGPDDATATQDSRDSSGLDPSEPAPSDRGLC